MIWKRWKPYLLGIGFAEGIGVLAALLSQNGIRHFRETVIQPPLSPPAWLFPAVWGILYALMGIGAARIWQGPARSCQHWSLNLRMVQLILNFFWTLIFFNAQAFGLAAGWLLLLWAAVAAMILLMFCADRLAAWLQVPYLLWLTFAAYLAFGVWLLN